MPSMNQLSQKVKDAIARGRAIPLLLDYRPENLPGHSLTVYGLIDSIEFEGTFCADDHKGRHWVAIPLSPCEERPVPELALRSDDAAAVHEIWSRWHNSVRANYLRFTEVVVQAINQARFTAALRNAQPVKAASEVRAKRRSTGRTKKSAVRKAQASKGRVRPSTAR